ncbi:MAG: hypothetical protein JXA66_00305 [Oligoflexia bacterium]|nr:hypothetical protein [Oligoflexia bacterium]
MAVFFITFSRLVRQSRYLWFAPFFLFLVFLSSRLIPVYYSNMPYVLFFSAVTGLALGVVLSVIMMVVLVWLVFPYGDDLKNEVILYRRLGAGVNVQFTVFYLFVMFSGFVMYIYISVLLWEFNVRYFLAVLVFTSFLVLARTLVLFLKIWFVFYILFAAFFVSLYFPLYIIPNFAYIISGGIQGAAGYTLMYVLIYYIIANRLYIGAWRQECIGWI